MCTPGPIIALVPSGKGVPHRTRADTFARLFEAVHEGVFVGTLTLDPLAEGTTEAVNPFLKAMLGYAPGTADGRVAPFAAERFVDPAARQAFLGRLLVEGAVTDYLIRLRRMDGDLIWVEVTAHAGPSRKRGISQVEALMRNVSERRGFDDQSRDLYQQLLQAEKMAALGQTISGVAHELNNPLATILSWAERLAEKQLDDDVAARGRRHPWRIRARRAHRAKSADVCAKASVDALDDRSESSRPRDAGAARLRAAAHEHHVVTALASGLPPVFADPHQIQQVLLNLVINAEQAMLAANGRGSLVCARGTTPHTTRSSSKSVTTGRACRPRCSKIFDPFFTTKEVGKGTGLGIDGRVRHRPGARR